MLPVAPLPKWTHLIKAVLLKSPSADALTALWRGPADVAGWLSRSTWSLALIALWRANLCNVTVVTVWIPDFFCNSSLLALRRTGANLVFYPLTDDLNPDMPSCRALAESRGPPDIFVVVHYFGRPCNVSAAREFCVRHRTWLVEDAVHVLTPSGEVGVSGDFVLYSPHKHLPIPDGAVLVVRGNGPSKLQAVNSAVFGPPSEWPQRLQDLSRRLGVNSNAGVLHSLIWIIKRVIQKTGIYWIVKRHISASPESRSLSDTVSVPARPSLMGRRLAAAVIPDLPVVARCRQRNQLVWDELLRTGLSGLYGLTPMERSEHRDWVPYLSSYEFKRQGESKMADRTGLQRLNASSWPELSPEINNDAAFHATAIDLQQTRVYLPVNQSLTTGVIAKVARAGEKRRRERLSTTSVEIVWDTCSQKEWIALTRRSVRSNLLQAWSYGAAKCQTEGWEVARGVVNIGNEAVAVIQVLFKKYLGIIKLIRVNRGPLLLRPLSPEEELALWSCIGCLGSVWRGRVLSIAPELLLSGHALLRLSDLGFTQTSTNATESLEVNLQREVEELRNSLDGKWRNMLSSSEKSGLTVEIDDCGEHFRWMLERYQSMLVEKRFRGVESRLISSIKNNRSGSEDLITLRAIKEGEPVAGICVARHGGDATYLLGWSGPQGRALKATHFLLWRAIIYLKECGSLRFDLGGISEDNTPGVTAFKLGLRGDRYELVGEYWKW